MKFCGLVVCIDNMNRERFITERKIYRVKEKEHDESCFYTVVDDCGCTKIFLKERFRPIVIYPNTSLFRKLYPNAEIHDGFLIT